MIYELALQIVSRSRESGEVPHVSLFLVTLLPPLFLALGLFPFALFRNTFYSRVSCTPMCAFWPSPSADSTLTTLLNTIVFSGCCSLQVKYDSCPTQC